MTAVPPPVPQSAEERHRPDPSDEELVRIYQEAPASERSRLAAETLFARYHRRVYLWCLRLARDHERAMDLAQEALLTALHDLRQFEHRSRFATWLYTVVRRRALRLLHRERKWLMDDTDLDEFESKAADPADQLLLEDEAGWLMTTIRERLDPTEAAALVLRCEEGLPVEDITRLLELKSASGARGVLQSARRKLRAALERRREQEGSR